MPRAYYGWPRADIELWKIAIVQGQSKQWARQKALSGTTVRGWTAVWSGYLKFIRTQKPELLGELPSARVTPALFSQFAVVLRQRATDASVAIQLYNLIYVIMRLCPDRDWSWMRPTVRSFSRAGKPKKRTSVCRGMSYESWPEEDRRAWEQTFQGGSRFGNNGTAHLSDATKIGLRYATATYFGFLQQHHLDLLQMPLEQRVSRDIAAEYAAYLRKHVRDRTVVARLDGLHLAMKYLLKEDRCHYLRSLRNRIASVATKLPKPKTTSHELAELGFELMASAERATKTVGHITETAAVQYRDGLVIVTKTSFALRRRAFHQIRVGRELTRRAGQWFVNIPAAWSKNKRGIELPASKRLSRCIDVYLAKYRNHIPGARTHSGLWPSMSGKPMDDQTIWEIFVRRTQEKFDFPVSPHHVRHAAATGLAVTYPDYASNALGHRSRKITDEVYTHVPMGVAAAALDQSAGRRLERMRSLLRTPPPRRKALRSFFEPPLSCSGFSSSIVVDCQGLKDSERSKLS